MKKLKITGIALIIISMILSYVWFDYKLAIIVYIAIFGNNIEQGIRNFNKFKLK